MPITNHDKLTILKDILQNQQEDCCGTIAECQQMQRLIQSMIGSQNLDSHSRETLENIYLYSQQAQKQKHFNDFISSQQHEISQWVQGLENSNLS